MKNDIILTRKVDAKCWHIEATIAIAKERNELMSVLIRALENTGTTSDDIARHLLFDASSRKKVAERLLNITEMYGLMTRDEQGYILTQEGNTAINSKRVFVPEEGTWDFWVSDDPLLPDSVLLVTSYNEPSASNEILGKKNNERSKNFKSLPGWIFDLEGSFSIPCIDGNEVRFDEIKEMAEAVEVQTDLYLIWNVSKGEMKLTGNLNGKIVDNDLTAPDIDPADAWSQLLMKERLLDDWNAEQDSLRVSFSDTNDVERKTMHRDLVFDNPAVDSFGEFDRFIATGILIAPDTNANAQVWAEWRLQESISDYATSERFHSLWERANTPFVEFEIDKPDRSKYAVLEWYKNTEVPSHRAWYLIAAEDWRL
jgi:hypothetical protein